MSAVLDADSVGKQFGSTRVLTAASLRAERGHMVALLGRNGAGKSTLLKICAGLLRADYGRIAFCGETAERPRLYQLARRGLCYLPSETGLFSTGLSLRQQLTAIASQRKPEQLETVIQTLALERVLDQSPLDLSGGEQRRASVAMAWLLQPVCLLADEPLRGIDPKDQECVLAVMRLMCSDGVAVVITGHQAAVLLDAVDEVVWTTNGTTHQLGAPAAAREHWQFQREFLGPR